MHISKPELIERVKATATVAASDATVAALKSEGYRVTKIDHPYVGSNGKGWKPDRTRLEFTAERPAVKPPTKVTL